MQIGHGSFAQLGCGGQLEECGGVGALGRNGEQSRPAGDPGRDGGRSQVGWNGPPALLLELAINKIVCISSSFISNMRQLSMQTVFVLRAMLVFAVGCYVFVQAERAAITFPAPPLS